MGNNNLEDPSEDDAAETPAKTGSFKVSTDPVTFAESEGDVHKFDVRQTSVSSSSDAPTSSPAAPDFDDLGELPTSYHEDTLFLVARDPRWLFTYWDFDWSPYQASAMRGGIVQFFLKVITAEGADETLVEIKPEARNWYVPVSSPNSGYFAEIGFFEPDGTWRKVVQSGLATTPGEALATEEVADFATVPAHLSFERMLEMLQEHMSEGESLLSALSRMAGEGQLQFRDGEAPTWSDDQKRLLAALLGDTLIERLSLGSDEIDQLLRKQLDERPPDQTATLLLAASLFAPGPHSLSSGIGASWSAQPFSVHAERGFFMHVNAEIIFYGGTHPDASVRINGQEIKLSPDGTFRYHFTLPDGDFSIPVIATSPDGVEQRSATLSFARGTAKTGQVDDSGQPENLGPLIGKK